MFPFCLVLRSSFPSTHTFAACICRAWMSLGAVRTMDIPHGARKPRTCLQHLFFVVAGFKKGNCLLHPYLFWEKPPVFKATCWAIYRRAPLLPSVQRKQARLEDGALPQQLPLLRFGKARAGQASCGTAIGSRRRQQAAVGGNHLLDAFRGASPGR